MKYAALLAALVLCAGLLPAEEPPAKEEKKEAAEEKPEKAAPNPHALIKTSMGDIEVVLFADEAPKTVANFLGLAEGKKEFKDARTGDKVKRPYFDGLVFHRVIKGFMIQGGCPLGNGLGNPGFAFEDEINGEALGLGKIKALNGGRAHGWLLIRSQQQFNQTVIGPLARKMGIKSAEDFRKRLPEIQKAVEALTLLDVYRNQGYKYDNTRKSHPPKKGSLAMANSGPNTNGSQFFLNLRDTPHLTGKHTVFGHVTKGMDIVEAIGEVKVGAASRPLEPVKILSIRRIEPKEVSASDAK